MYYVYIDIYTKREGKMIIEKLNINEYAVGSETDGADFIFDTFNDAEDFLFKNGYRQSDDQPDFQDGIWYYERF